MINELLYSRKEELFFYSPYSFLRSIDKNKLYKQTVLNSLLEIMSFSEQVVEIRNDGLLHVFLIEYLKWDSNYFKIPTFKLKTVLYNHNRVDVLGRAINLFTSNYFTKAGKYCFIEIPTEDITLIQALGLAKFKLIETRMTYYKDNLSQYNYERFPVRKARRSDINNLKIVAREMRNKYDRFHADQIIADDIADEFLATYIEQSIWGFADYVIVPNEKGTPPDAFLTAKYLKNEWGKIGANVSKLVLSSVLSKTCKGWYVKLISEMIYHLKSLGTEYVFMHPSSTNKAVIHTYEKLGCKLGQTNLVFSYQS